MYAGSRQAIFYMFCQLLDEILHAIPVLNNTDWAYRFCQWSHRLDTEEH